MNLLLLAIAVLPVIALSLFVYRKDKYEKEPIRLLVRAFLFGALSIIPAALMEGFISLFTPGIPVVDGLFTGFCVAGFCEELSKLVLLYLCIWNNRNFDEYFDGIVYATFLSLGFAFFENITYIFGQSTFFESFATGSMRAVLSVPAHFLFAVVMGYYFALAKFDRKHKASNLLKALLYPMLLHGTFDSLLMIPESIPTGQEIVSGVLFIVFIFFDIKMWKWGVQRINKLQELSNQQGFDRDNPFKGFTWEF